MNRKRLLTSAVGALVAAAIAGGVAYATIPGPGNVYSACMLKGTGTIRLIDKSLPSTNLMSHCTDKEIEISWNQAGQPGPPGPAGAKGEPGAPGTNGTNGTDGKDGAPGTNGTNGADGKDGVSVTTASESAGANCADGGVQLTAVNGVNYVCNGKAGADGKDGTNGTAGADGKDGANGTNGADGKDGVSVTSAAEPAGANCANGGSKFTAANGVTYACNGSDGAGGDTTGQDATTVFGTGSLTATTAQFIVLPGLTQTITVPANSKVYVSADGGFAPATPSNGAISVVDVALAVDTLIVSNAGIKRAAAKNETVTNGLVTTTVGILNWAFSSALSLPAGTHTIAVAGALANSGGGVPFSPNAATISGNSSSVLQGQLTVVIVKK